MLKINNISIKKGESLILDGISTSIKQASISFVGGKNGIGKSTLLRAILKIEKLEDGEILLNEENILSIQRNYFFSKVGAFIGQNYYMNLTVKENLSVVSHFYNCPKNRIYELVELFKLEKYLSTITYKLSSGLKQRLGLAIAFMHLPQLVLLDEPFNALDPESILELREQITKINATYFTTFLITCHSLDEVKRIFDKFIIIKDKHTLIEVAREDLKSMIYVEASNELELSSKDELMANAKGYLRDADDTIRFIIPRKTEYILEGIPVFKRNATIEDFYYLTSQAT